MDSLIEIMGEFQCQPFKVSQAKAIYICNYESCQSQLHLLNKENNGAIKHWFSHIHPVFCVPCCCQAWWQRPMCTRWHWHWAQLKRKRKGQMAQVQRRGVSKRPSSHSHSASLLLRKVCSYSQKFSLSPNCMSRSFYEEFTNQEIYKEFSSSVAAAKVNLSNRFLQFRKMETTLSFLTCSDKAKFEEFDLSCLHWLDLGDLELLEFQESSFWKNKFYDLRETPERIEGMTKDSTVSSENGILKVC